MNSGFWYVYEYKNDKRLRNVGFLKISFDSGVCIIELNLRKLPVIKGDTIELQACIQEDGGFFLRPAASFTCKTQSVCNRISIPLNVLYTKKEEAKKISGLIFYAGDACFGAFFEEITFSTEMIKKEIPEDKTVKPVEKKPSGEPMLWKISRSQMAALPKTFWPLANNSFLLHGCHNYHHLLLIKEKGQLRLGVPGLYDKREAAVAEFFGFPLFMQSYARLLSLEGEEADPKENFGYWCRTLYTIPFIS